MNNFKIVNMLVSFVDLSNFARNSVKMDMQQLAEFVSEFYTIVGDSIETNGGEILKFIGDEALIVFSEDKVNIGVKSLITCKEKVDKWLKDQGLNSQLVVKAHYGEMIYGRFGTKKRMANDVMGKSIGVAAVTRSNGFAITPQVFRKLDRVVRKLFKKHTPPITYIPLSEYHRD